MVIQYMINNNNGMLYKAVNNSILLMWSRNAKACIECCTKYQDLFKNNYLDNFKMLEENEIGKYK